MENSSKEPIDILYENNILDRASFKKLIEERDEDTAGYLFEKARIRQRETFGNKVYLRGLIEFSNYCRKMTQIHRMILIYWEFPSLL